MIVASARSYRLRAYCDAAESLGIGVVIASDGRHPLVPDGIAGLQLPFDPGPPAPAVADQARRLGVRAVVAADDEGVVPASQLAAALGCPRNPVAAARAARRKDLARQTLARAGIRTPWFRILHLGEPIAPQCAGVPYPCVVKPVALAGSRGVIRCDDPPALRAAIERVAAIAAQQGPAEERARLLVEAFVPGPEVAVEGLLAGGHLHVLAVFDKPDPLDGPYFEETLYVTPSRLAPASLAAVIGAVADAARAYGLREGPVHAELRIRGEEATLIELAARTIGGDCARLLRFGTGCTLEELVLLQAMGRPLGPPPSLQAGPAAGVLMLPTERAGTLRRVEGVLAARRVPLVEEVVIAVREGYELVPLPEGSQYLGFVFARGGSPQAVEAALRAAQAHIEVVTAPAWRLEGARVGREAV